MKSTSLFAGEVNAIGVDVVNSIVENDTDGGLSYMFDASILALRMTNYVRTLPRH